ncbi:PLP-dependent transferase [Brucella sp. 10RB9215]|uniref:PLP-dependent transferase n=1 Tax=Brucella sp. 10RB9215 TaxID=1149953 RepID=UPI001FCEBBEE|nr:PLP-dependent transferase [Brucella sp. 10RB9215]
MHCRFSASPTIWRHQEPDYHPATTTHKNLSNEAKAELGISDGLLRVSVGLEDTDDLLKMLKRAESSARLKTGQICFFCRKNS